MPAFDGPVQEGSAIGIDGIHLKSQARPKHQPAQFHQPLIWTQLLHRLVYL